MKKIKNSAFVRFFTQFPRLMLAEVMFSVPAMLCFAILGFIGYITGYNNIIVWLLGLIPTFPLYAGLVMSVRKIAVDKQSINVFSVFWDTVRSNLKMFFIHGVAAYLIVTLSVFAILYYSAMAQVESVYSAVLMIYVFMTVVLAGMMLYVPVMSVTYELRIRDIYKNSFMLVFGKILRTLIALVSVGAFALGGFMLLMFTSGIWLALSGVLLFLTFPLLYTYISISIISKGLQDAVGSFTEPQKPEKPQLTEEELIKQQTALSNTDSDYVFVNGRMVKK